MNENRFNFKLNFFLTFFLVLAAVFSFWFFVSLPLMKSADKFLEDFRTSRNLLASSIQKEDRYDELKRLNQEVESKLPALAGTVLSEENVLDFVVSLEDLARSSKVFLTIGQAPSVPAVKGDNFGVLSFRLNVWGRSPNLYQFLHLLENLDFWTSIEEVRIVKLNDFTLPTGPGFAGLALNDVSAVINLNVFLGD